MGDPARQHTQAFQLLRLLQALAHHLALGHVPAEDRQSVPGRVGVHFEPTRKGRIVFLEVRAYPVFHAVQQTAACGGAQTLEEQLPQILAQQFLAGDVRERYGLLIDVRASPFAVKGHEAVAEAFENIADLLVRFLECGAGFLERPRHRGKGLREGLHLGWSSHRHRAVKVSTFERASSFAQQAHGARDQLREKE